MTNLKSLWVRLHKMESLLDFLEDGRQEAISLPTKTIKVLIMLIWKGSNINSWTVIFFDCF